MTAIFISHSSADNPAAAEMKAWLEAQGHTSLFLDFDPEAGIRGGAAWEQTLYKNLRQCQAVIALLTPDWLASKWCFAELVQARERGKAIFPVKVLPCEASHIFSDIQHIDLTVKSEEGYERLRIGLLERGLDPLDVFDWDPKRVPYPGLLAFQEQDAAIFFGRGDDILKTLETLDALWRQGSDAGRFVLLLGASGSGKSSLARAGVIPRLKKRLAEWLPVPPFRPQIEPLDELAVALSTAFQASGQPRDWSAIRTVLMQAATQTPADGFVLQGLARDLAVAAKQPEATVLLAIDQAEELFGYSPAEAATRFLRLLRAALESGDRRLMALATLRSDFLGEFQKHPVLQDGEYPHHFRYRAATVDPMPLKSFPEVIQGPARLAGLHLDDGLVEAMVSDTGTRDALPLLAFTLRRLYERFGSDGRLSVDEYESLGRLEGAIRGEAERIITEANPSQDDLEALHGAFVPTMVRINAEGGYARRRALFDDLPRRAMPLLRRFVDARLLVTDRNSDGRETMEVAHEALLRTWPQLGVWLAEDQDRLRLLESLQRAAEEWDQGGRRDDLLVHRDGRLKDSEALVGNPRFTLPEASVERSYLGACSAAQQTREAAEKEEQERRIRDAERIADEQKRTAEVQKRSLRRTRRLLLVVALVAGFASWQYWVAEQETRRTNAARLAIAADKAIDDEKLLLALEAVRAAPTPEAQAVLGKALDTPLKKMLRGHGRQVEKVVFSRDGKRLASADEKKVILWDMDHERPVGEMSQERYISDIAFSADGKRLAIWSYANEVGPSIEGTGILSVWDVGTMKRLGELLDEKRGFRAPFAFSPDGKRIVSASAGNSLRLWDAVSGEPLLGESLSGHKDRVVDLAFSPDGKTLTSVSLDLTVRQWNTETGEALGATTLEGDMKPMDCAIRNVRGLDSTIRCVAVSPNGQYLASTGTDNTSVQVWDARSGKALGKSLEGHRGSVVSLAFSPDSQYLASGDSDGSYWLWHLHMPGEVGGISGEQAGHADRTPPFGPGVTSIAFGPDGTIFASASGPVVLLWWSRAKYSQGPENACSIVNRNLTHSEWKTAMGDKPYRKTCPDLPDPDEEVAVTVRGMPTRRDP